MYLIIHELPRLTWTVKELLREFRRRGLSARKVLASELSSTIEGGRVEVFVRGRSFEGVDGVILRSIGSALTLNKFLSRISILKCVEGLGVPVVNPVEPSLIARNKYESLRILASNGLRVPETLLTENPLQAISYSRGWGASVVKPLTGSQGFGSLLISEADMAFNISKTLVSLGQPIYLQKYVEKPDRDIRAFVVGGELLGAIYRVSRGSWKTNIAQGGEPQPCKVDSELEEASLKAVEALGLNYAGVDLVEGSEGYYILEVNASPNWRGFQSISKINVASKIVELIISLSKR